MPPSGFPTRVSLCLGGDIHVNGWEHEGGERDRGGQTDRQTETDTESDREKCPGVHGHQRIWGAGAGPSN